MDRDSELFLSGPTNILLYNNKKISNPKNNTELRLDCRLLVKEVINEDSDEDCVNSFMKMMDVKKT